MMDRAVEGSSIRSNNRAHQSSQFRHNRRTTHGNHQEPGVDLICKVKYSNTLPNLPFEPKFLQCPFIGLDRFVSYKSSTLEKNFKYELLTEPDLNVKIDLINPSTYQIDPHEKPQIHPIDEQLLEDESISQLNSKRSIQHRKVVPWMRKTEYISTEFNRYGLGQTGVDRPDTKVGYGMKKRIKDEPVEFKDRASQISAIEHTFADAKRPIRQHYSRQGVSAVEEFEIFPDFEMWKYPFAQVIFDADPLPYCKNHREEKLSQSILRGMADSEGTQFVGYFSPFDDALEQRIADDEIEIGSYKEGFQYQYKLEREYNWKVYNKASKDYEQENYFLVRRGNVFSYNELETRVRLSRRQKSNLSSSKNTILLVTNRLLNSKELAQMNHRTNMLFAIHEEEEEETQDEEVEEEAAKETVHTDEDEEVRDEEAEEGEAAKETAHTDDDEEVREEEAEERESELAKETGHTDDDEEVQEEEAEERETEAAKEAGHTDDDKEVQDEEVEEGDAHKETRHISEEEEVQDEEVEEEESDATS